MDKIENWFNQAKNIATTFKTQDSEFIIYKGFKITKRNNEYHLQDVRFSNFYDEVDKKDLAKLIELGFKDGVDLLSFERDSIRVSMYNRRLEALRSKRVKFQEKPTKSQAFNEKWFRNSDKKIEAIIELLYFYQVRVKQFNIKNKKNEQN